MAKPVHPPPFLFELLFVLPVPRKAKEVHGTNTTSGYCIYSGKKKNRLQKNVQVVPIIFMRILFFLQLLTSSR